MASSSEFMEFVYERIKHVGDISYKKMFGEYGVYYKEKFIAFVADDRFILKKTDEAYSLIPKAELVEPYPNAKPHLLIENLDDKSLIRELITLTYQELPEAKPKKKKIKKDKTK